MVSSVDPTSAKPPVTTSFASAKVPENGALKGLVLPVPSVGLASRGEEEVPLNTATTAARELVLALNEILMLSAPPRVMAEYHSVFRTVFAVGPARSFQELPLLSAIVGVGPPTWSAKVTRTRFPTEQAIATASAVPDVPPSAYEFEVKKVIPAQLWTLTKTSKIRLINRILSRPRVSNHTVTAAEAKIQNALVCCLS